MGLAEMSTFGAVYQGRVLNARCYQREYSPDKIAKSFRNSDFASNANSSSGSVGPYIKGPSLRNDDDFAIHCGMELVSAVSNMFAHTNYTGLYCANWKLDTKMRPKMMEVNARFCGTLRTGPGDALLASSVTMLAYAALEDHRQSEAYRARSALLHSANKPIYERIREEEQRALATGGGYVEGVWEGATTFDMTRRLDPLLPTYGIF